MRQQVALGFLLALACTRTHWSPPADVVHYHREEWLRFSRAMATFNVADGIDRQEGTFIAEAFFVWKFGLCGGPQQPEDGGAEWLAVPRVGYSGRPDDNLIRIDKVNGAISYGSEARVPAGLVIKFDRQRHLDNLREFAGEELSFE